MLIHATRILIIKTNFGSKYRKQNWTVFLEETFQLLPFATSMLADADLYLWTCVYFLRYSSKGAASIIRRDGQLVKNAVITNNRA